MQRKASSATSRRSAGRCSTIKVGDEVEGEVDGVKHRHRIEKIEAYIPPARPLLRRNRRRNARNSFKPRRIRQRVRLRHILKGWET